MTAKVTLHVGLEQRKPAGHADSADSAESAESAEKKTMPRKSRAAGGSEMGATPSQQDESAIIAEIGAAPTGDGSGELEGDENKILEAGAVDSESVLENRRSNEIVGKVRSGQKGVLFNLDNVLEKYDLVIRTWPPNTIDILASRVTGTPVQWVIQSRPRSGAELYAAL